MPYFLSLLARAYWKTGRPQEGLRAMECFRRAIETARRQAARSWELRAASSLARLLIVSGRRAEAHRTLAGIYDWFTEGFDTVDVGEAKVLLDDTVRT